MNVNTNGYNTNATGLINDFLIGEGPTYSNSVVVTGSNSSLNVGGDFFVGWVGSDNTLIISNGGVVNVDTNSNIANHEAVVLQESQGFVIGELSASNSVLVTGSNSTLSAATGLIVGWMGSGTLTVANGGTVVAPGGLIIASGSGSLGTLNIGSYGGSDTAGFITNTPTIAFGSGTGTINFNQSDTATLTSSISGVGSVNQLGGGTTILTGNSSYSGLTTISNGVLQLGDGSSSVGFGTSAISNNASLVLNSSGTLTMSGAISGSGSLSQIGRGVSILSGNNSYSRGTTINQGTLVAANSNALAGGNLTLNGGTLGLQSSTTVNNFAWNNPTATSSIVSVLSPNSLINVSGALTVSSNSTSYFNLSGDNLGSTPVSVLAWNTNNAQAITTNNFSLTELPSTSYILSITNVGSQDLLQVVLLTLPVNSGGTTVVSSNSTYPSVTFGSNSSLNINASGNLTVSSATTISNNSTVILNGTMTTPSLNVGPNGLLMGSGNLNGNLNNNGTVKPGNSPGTLTVNGNYTQTSSGNLNIEVASPTLYDKLVVNGNATLGGTLNIIPYGGGGLQFGEQFSILTASNITGAFSSIVAPEGYRGRLLVEGDPTAVVIIAPSSYAEVAANQNQTNVALALNSFIPATSGDKMAVSIALDSLTPAQYNQAFNAIMPTFYQSLATIAFNSANAQNSELVQRLWGLRVAGTGFSMTGLADNTFVLEGQGDGDKGVLDSKKDILRPGADTHWGMFVDGNGIFAQATSASMLPTYNYESGGITTGFTYKWNENFGTGVYAGYEGTYAKYGANGSGLGVGSSLIDNAVRFGLFGTYGQRNSKGEAVGFYADALAGGGYNNYQASRIIQFPGLNRTATSSPGGGELDSMLAGGYDVKAGNFTFGPMASLQYTYLGVNGVNETGAQSLNFTSAGWNTASMLSSLGAHAAYTWKASKHVLVVPQISLNWQHEFMQNAYAINGNLGGSPSFANWSATPIRDSLYTGVGFTVEFGKRWDTSLFYNASAGNANTTSQNIFWSAGVRF